VEGIVGAAKRVGKKAECVGKTMNTLWYYRRLRSMGPAEVFWRIRRLLWQIHARLWRRRWQLQYERSSMDSPRALEAIGEVKFYGLAGGRPEDVAPGWVDGTIAGAKKLLQHKYEYLGLGEIDLGKRINWNREYKRGIDTPLLFGPWMDYRDTESYGDFKYFWELPRFQHLITMAKAYYLTGEERYAEEVMVQIKGFVEQSPCLLGVNWIMPMEASIRLVSISWITAFLKSYLENHRQACGLIERVVKSHVGYVAGNYAAYSSANNHLIGEAAGVFIASLCFGQLKKMQTYRRKAYDILCREIIRQNHADGVNKEQAVHYQLFALSFLLLTALLGRANGIEFPSQYWRILEENAAFIAAISDDDCLAAEIGDSDDGKAIVLSETGDNIVRSILATSAVLFERGDFKAKAGRFDETSFWLLGNEGRDRFDALSAEPGVTKKAFEQGGYYILSSSNGTKAKVIFDCGSLGFGSISAHGHADSLSFVLNAHGRRYFVDPGTYTYVAKDPYRNYFRSTAAHNTVVVDGQDQSQMAGPFLWSHKANSYLEKWESGSRHDRVVARHDGYERLPDPVTHRRAINLDKEQEVVIIDDYLEMKGSHKLEQYFHLAPECQAEMVGGGTWYITNSGSKIELIADEQLDCRIANGSENPICGWCSHAYDRKQPTNTIVCAGTFSGDRHFVTRIRLAV